MAQSVVIVAGLQIPANARCWHKYILLLVTSPGNEPQHFHRSHGTTGHCCAVNRHGACVWGAPRSSIAKMKFAGPGFGQLSRRVTRPRHQASGPSLRCYHCAMADRISGVAALRSWSTRCLTRMCSKRHSASSGLPQARSSKHV